MNPTQHDELARLFAHNMQLSAAVEQQRSMSAPPAQSQMPFVEVLTHSEKQAEQQPQPPPVHFISSHYTGTAHVVASGEGGARSVTSEPSRSPPPPYHEALMPEAMAEGLRQHGVNPAALLPNQIHLFQNADHEQRLRLLELWQIAPPSYPLEVQQVQLNGAWDNASTSIEREEQLARTRYEQQQQQQQQQNSSVWASMQGQEEHMLDTHIPKHVVEPISPIREPGETPWPPAARMRAASIIASGTDSSPAEPYIVSGYSQARSSPHAVDPVYAAATGLWQAPSYAQAIQEHQQQHQHQQQEQQWMMENQYGMLQEQMELQVRNHADWERVNEQLAREKLAQAMSHSSPASGVAQDEDMVM